MKNRTGNKTLRIKQLIGILGWQSASIALLLMAGALFIQPTGAELSPQADRIELSTTENNANPPADRESDNENQSRLIDLLLF